MTAYRFVTLTCDNCGEVYDNGLNIRIPECRESARREGWARGINGRTTDYCPKCHAGGLGIRYATSQK